MKLILAFSTLAVLTLAAQENKTTPSKQDKAAAEARARLNKLKQDERNKELFKKAEAALKKAEKNNAAAKSEVERMTKTDERPEEKEARAKLEKLKNSVDPEEMKEFERLLKESTESLKEEFKNYREKQRNERPAPAVPSVAPDPAPVNFESVPGPVPLAMLKGPAFPVSPPVKADRMIKGPSRDPRNPDKVLPDSDPRTRTLVLNGNVHIRRPMMALDADEVDLLLKEGEDSSIVSGGAPNADPNGRARREGGPFERIVARGRVRVMFVDSNGTVKVGRGGSMIYEEKTGIFVIKEWPEAEVGDKLIRGSSKGSVIKLSDLKSEDPAVDGEGLELFTLERKLSAEELPRTPDQPVPAAGPVKPKAGSAPSPAPR